MATDSNNLDYLKSKTAEHAIDGASDISDVSGPIVVMSDKEEVRKEFKVQLDRFMDYERGNGVSVGSAKQHRSMIVSCISVLRMHRRKIRLDRITVGDMECIGRDLEAAGVKHHTSYPRVFAAFIAFITDSEPIIDLGGYGRRCNRFLLMSQPDEDADPRVEGNSLDRIGIEERFRNELDAFAEHELSCGLDPRTTAAHRRSLDASIYVLEGRHRPLVFTELTSHDMAYLNDYLTDFGVNEPSRTVNVFVRFVAFVTDSEPLIDLKQEIPRIRPKFPPEYRSGFRFGKELDRYAESMELKGYSRKTILLGRTYIINCCGILDARSEGFDLRNPDPKSIGILVSELEDRYCRDVMGSIISRFSDFVLFTTGIDLKEESKVEGYRIMLDPETEYDRIFVEQLRGFIRHMEDWGYKEHTIKGRISVNTVCYKRLKEIKGDFELKDITPMDIRKLRDSFAGYSEGTIRQNMYIFGWFIRHETGYNPCEEARLTYNVGTESRQFIFKEDWVKLYENADVMERLILALGATMGLRRREIMNLGVDDIIGEKLRIHGKGTGKDGKVVVVGMTDLVRRNLDDYLIARKQILSIFGDRTGGALFIGMSKRTVGKPLTERSFGTILDHIQNKSGVSFSSHCLRRFFCTTMSDAGVDLDTIRRMMRHSSLETTLKCYLHADPRKMAGAVSKINDVFGSITG